MNVLTSLCVNALHNQENYIVSSNNVKRIQFSDKSFDLIIIENVFLIVPQWQAVPGC